MVSRPFYNDAPGRRLPVLHLVPLGLLACGLPRKSGKATASYLDLQTKVPLLAACNG